MTDFIDFVTHNFYFVAAIIGALAFVYATFRIAVNNAAKESNQILRDLNSDKDSKIKLLDEKQEEILGKLKELERRIEYLTRQKKTYEDLITEALRDHFKAHPDMALELDSSVRRRKNAQRV